MPKGQTINTRPSRPDRLALLIFGGCDSVFTQNSEMSNQRNDPHSALTDFSDAHLSILM